MAAISDDVHADKKRALTYRSIPRVLKYDDRELYSVNGGFSGVGNQTGATAHALIVNSGSDPTDRQTNVILLGRCRLWWMVRSDTATTSLAVRFGLAYDRQSNGAVPPSTDLLSGTTPIMNPEYEEKYILLFDRWTDVAGNQAAAPTNSSVIRTGYDEFDINLPTIYKTSTTSGAIANVISGALIGYAWGSNVSGTTDSQVQYWCDIRYYNAYIPGSTRA